MDFARYSDVRVTYITEGSKAGTEVRLLSHNDDITIVHYLAPGAEDFAAPVNEEALNKKASGILSMLPLIITIGGQRLFPTEYALGLGVIVLILVNLPRLTVKSMINILSEGVPAAVIICASFGAMAGFGNIVKATPVFQMIINHIPDLPGSPLVSLLIATNIMCAITGTATGAAAIVARVICMPATAFDSVPHNSGVINYVYTFGHEDFKSAYPMIFLTSVVGPLFATAAAIFISMAFGPSTALRK